MEELGESERKAVRRWDERIEVREAKRGETYSVKDAL